MNSFPRVLRWRASTRMLSKHISIDPPHTISAPHMPIYSTRSIVTTTVCQIKRKKDTDSETDITVKGYFNTKERSRNSFIAACEVFKEKGAHRRGHVEFIYAALAHMEEFGVHRDLGLYKELLDLMPKGKMIPRNMFQVEFMHYPKHQHCAIDILGQMEDNGVMPDSEVQLMIRVIFGRYSDPYKKCARMLYWMPKFKNASPWKLPEEVPDDAFELAKLAVARMCSVDPSSKLTIFETKDVEDAIDDTWIVSGMSPTQEELISQHPEDEPLKVEGPFRIFLRYKCCGYFILRGEGKVAPPPMKPEEIDDVEFLKSWFTGEMEEEDKSLTKKRSVHEQDDGVIMAICATGTSSRDSLLSWIRQLQEKNPNLSKIPVLFTQKSPIGDVIVTEQDNTEVGTTS